MNEIERLKNEHEAMRKVLVAIATTPPDRRPTCGFDCWASADAVLRDIKTTAITGHALPTALNEVEQTLRAALAAIERAQR